MQGDKREGEGARMGGGKREEKRERERERKRRGRKRNLVKKKGGAHKT